MRLERGRTNPDAYYEDWPATLDAIAALKPEKLVLGRGAALTTP